MTRPAEEPDSEPDGRTAELARLAGAGDRARFGELYARVAPAVFAWSTLRIPDALHGQLDAEDVVQEVWVRALARFATFDPERGPFRAWLFGIARHVLLHALRTLRERSANGDRSRVVGLADVPDDVTSITRRVTRDEDVRALLAAVELLPDEDRQLVVLHGLEGRSLGAAGAVLGIGREAAKKRWQRLRPRLAGAAGLIQDEPAP